MSVVMEILSLSIIFATLGMLWQSIWKKEELISEAAWDRLAARPNLLRSVFGLAFLSFVFYLFAESAELISLVNRSETLIGLHEFGEFVHMIINVVVVFMVLSLFLSMRGDKNAP